MPARLLAPLAFAVLSCAAVAAQAQRRVEDQGHLLWRAFGGRQPQVLVVGADAPGLIDMNGIGVPFDEYAIEVSGPLPGAEAESQRLPPRQEHQRKLLQCRSDQDYRKVQRASSIVRALTPWRRLHHERVRDIGEHSTRIVRRRRCLEDRRVGAASIERARTAIGFSGDAGGLPEAVPECPAQR